MPDETAAPGGPADYMMVTSLETLKVFSDPLRMQILDLLRKETMSVKEIAARVQTTPKKLYYHINMMEEHGLIRVVSTRVVSGITEKRYQATALLCIFDDSLFHADTPAGYEHVRSMIGLTFDSTRDGIRAGVQAGLIDLSREAQPAHTLFIGWQLRRMAPEQAEAFYARLQEVCDDFEHGEGDPAIALAQPYRLLISLYPSAQNPPPQLSKEKITSTP